MPNPWTNLPPTGGQVFFPEMKRVRQKTSFHCGPAVLEALCSFVGVNLDQDQFVEAVGIAHKLKDYGMTIAEMGRALAKLAPELGFYYKQGSTLADLREIIQNYKFPVGVEWQGVFYDDSDEDSGHYGVVTQIDTVNNIVMISDPYKRFAGVDRQFHILEFQDWWWDENEIRDPASGSVRTVREERMMFVITPQDSLWPENLGMVRGG